MEELIRWDCLFVVGVGAAKSKSESNLVSNGFAICLVRADVEVEATGSAYVSSKVEPELK